jgi:hypothetical protein
MEFEELIDEIISNDPPKPSWRRQTYPAPLGRRGFDPRDSYSQKVPTLRRWRFEMKLSPSKFDKHVLELDLNLLNFFRSGVTGVSLILTFIL